MKAFTFHPLTVLDQLQCQKSTLELSALLEAKGMPAKDAQAVASNTALAWHACEWEEKPADPVLLLSLMGLREIAGIVKAYGHFLEGAGTVATKSNGKEGTA